MAYNKYNKNNGKPKKPPVEVKDNATAPYNFVPLPPTMVEAPFMDADGENQREKYISYVNNNENLSGVIELEVETETPFFIGGGSNGEFFAPVEKRPIIPGSTIRGMTKNLMKILACGAMRPSSRKSIDSDEIEGDGDFHDRKLFFRTMAEAILPIRKAYTSEMVSNPPKGSGEKPTSKAAAGFLIRFRDKDGTHYGICPTTAEPRSGISVIKKFEVLNTRDEDAKCGKAAKGKAGECVQWNWDDKGKKCVACFTGEMNTGKKKWDYKLNREKFVGKAHYTIHVIPDDWSKTIPVSSEVIITYLEDSTRGGVNLLDPKMGKHGTAAKDFTGRNDVDFVVPCFYVGTQKEVKHFGFGRYYRIPYDNTIAAHIPDVLHPKTPIPDFTDAIFGRKEDWGSRVFFEDCICEVHHPTPLEKDYSHVLSSPNPTSFQLYLKQNNDGTLNHWNSKDENKQPILIRGYKLYWHWKNDPKAWCKDENEPVLTGAEEIAPLPAGTKFYGKIRFERLSEEELGALLKIFSFASDDENTEICFKLGAGKSIGMGSVKIKATLKTIERDAYTELFRNGMWNKGETETSDFSKYTQKFDEYLKGKLVDNYDDYTKMCDVLRVMMNWRHTEKIADWNTKVKGMKSEVAQRDPEKKTKENVDTRFRNRSILPDAKTVVSRAEGKP